MVQAESKFPKIPQEIDVNGCIVLLLKMWKNFTPTDLVCLLDKNIFMKALKCIPF